MYEWTGLIATQAEYELQELGYTVQHQSIHNGFSIEVGDASVTLTADDGFNNDVATIAYITFGTRSYGGYGLDRIGEIPVSGELCDPNFDPQDIVDTIIGAVLLLTEQKVAQQRFIVQQRAQWLKNARKGTPSSAS